MANFKKMAKEIIDYVGGLDNIKEMSHCMTRLRLGLKDELKVKKHELETIDGVMRVVVIGGQYQIVLGGIVDEVFEEASKIVGDNVNVNKEMIQENLDSDTQRKKFNLIIIGYCKSYHSGDVSRRVY